MQNTAAQTASTLTVGDVVWGRPVVEGKTLNRCKGIVIGTLLDTQSELVVWWYGMGDATSDNTSLMFRNELTKAGDIFDFNGRQAARLAAASDTGYGRARSVRNALASHARRMLSIGVK